MSRKTLYKHRHGGFLIQMLSILSIGMSMFCTSCGMIEMDMEEQIPVVEMRLEHDTVWVMVGDTFHIEPVFTPDTVTLSDIYWFTYDTDIAATSDNNVVALAEGNTTLTGISVAQRITASCLIRVLPFWSAPSDSEYPYEMVVYADATVNGEPLDTTRYVLGAFCGDECRGVAKMYEHNNKRYYAIRIMSNETPSQEEGLWNEFYTFRCYDRKDYRMYYSPAYVVFDEESHGMLSNLFKLEFKK